MEMINKWHDELEEKLETATEPISAHDLLIIAYRTNELINSPEVDKIAHDVCLNFDSGDDFTVEAQKIFWELERYIVFFEKFVPLMHKLTNDNTQC